MAQMLRCTMPHWQGEVLIAAGTVVDPGSGTVVFAPVGATGETVTIIDDYFEPFETEEPKPARKSTRRTSK